MKLVSGPNRLLQQLSPFSPSFVTPTSHTRTLQNTFKRFLSQTSQASPVKPKATKTTLKKTKDVSPSTRSTNSTSVGKEEKTQQKKIDSSLADDIDSEKVGLERGVSEVDSQVGAQYQKKSQREHILLRPEPYLGSIDLTTERLWILSSPFSLASTKSEDPYMMPRVVESDVTYNPALYKIFDEILVNAADNVHRNEGKVKMTYIDVHIDAARNRISVENNGASIPIVPHPTEHCYVPELIFGHLLTSSNYDDAQSRFTGGRHGFGAKLTNIFSQQFEVDILDTERKLHYSQRFTDNMSQLHPPHITPAKQYQAPHSLNSKTNNHTRISFQPDLPRFHTTSLDGDILRLMHRRVLDLAASLGKSGVAVYLNGVRMPVKDFKQYLNICPLFIGHGNASDTIVESSSPSSSEDPLDLEADMVESKGKLVCEQVNEHWFVGVTAQHDDDANSFASMRHLSFVNNVATSRGGSHVNHVADAVARYICSYMNEPKRKKKLGLSADVNIGHVKSRMSVFVSCNLPNPTFDSQTKDLLMTPIRAPGSTMKNAVEGIVLPESFLQRVCRSSGVVGLVVDTLQAKETREVLRKTRVSKNSVVAKHKLLNIEKLDDAHLAGSGRSEECTLILTEGDSAKALALAGLGVLGRDKYGVYPLKGKLLNARDVSKTTLLANKELAEVARILGLQLGMDYVGEGLRYGRVMVMADQDHDGSHIKGLLLNAVQCLWPSLLKRSFIQQFVTPIVKATWTGRGKITVPSSIHYVDVRTKKGSQSTTSLHSSTNTSVTASTLLLNDSTLAFYSLEQFQKWQNAVGSLKQYKTKYYKGLGTSTSAEGREYFSLLENHLIDFTRVLRPDEDALELAFSKHMADARKTWLQHVDTSTPTPTPTSTSTSPSTSKTVSPIKSKSTKLATHTPQTHTPQTLKQVSVHDFVHHELIQFSHADNIRSIPSLIDGLKPGQRKILYACLKRNLTHEIKVAQLSGYVAERTGYHHGEQSLNGTIVSMAQEFPFSNNLALLLPLGQFGTRNMGGKDSASARYIFTKLNPFVRQIFPAADDVVLTQQFDDGDPIEPTLFYPILPLLLVNGCTGIGTGYSTSIPSHNPLQLCDAVLSLLDPLTHSLDPLVPWTRGFTGTLEPAESSQTIPSSPLSIPSHFYSDMSVEDRAVLPPLSFPLSDHVTKYLSTGRYSVDAKRHCITVSELPWGMWNNTFKQTLINMLESNKDRKGPVAVAHFTENSPENGVLFQIHLSPEMFALVCEMDVEKVFKLTSSVHLTNLHCFDSNGDLRQYQDAREMLVEFVHVRVGMYATRRKVQLASLEHQVAVARSKASFIDLVVSGELVLGKRQKSDLVQELFSHRLLPYFPKHNEVSSHVSLDLASDLDPSTDDSHNSNSNSNSNSISSKPSAFVDVGPVDITTIAAHHHLSPLNPHIVYRQRPFALHVEGDNGPASLPTNAYDYLLNLPLLSLTDTRLRQLHAEVERLQSTLTTLQNTSAVSLWKNELHTLRTFLEPLYSETVSPAVDHVSQVVSGAHNQLKQTETKTSSSKTRKTKT